MKHLTRKQICAALGISEDQLWRWTRGPRPLLEPALRTPGGHARYSPHDVALAKFIRLMLEAGVRGPKLRRVIAAGVIDRAVGALREGER